MTDNTELIAQLRTTTQKLRRTPQPISTVAPMLTQAADALESAQAEVARKEQYGKEWMEKYLDSRAELDAALARLAELEKQEPCAVFLGWNDDGSAKLDAACEGPESLGENNCLYLAPGASPQPRLKVRLTTFPESNGKRNWTALLVREEKWDGLVGNCGGVSLARGELWNRVAWEAECARYLIGKRDTEPFILDYGDDIETPDQWPGETHDRHRSRQGA